MVSLEGKFKLIMIDTSFAMIFWQLANITTTTTTTIIINLWTKNNSKTNNKIKLESKGKQRKNFCSLFYYTLTRNIVVELNSIYYYLVYFLQKTKIICNVQDLLLLFFENCAINELKEEKLLFGERKTLSNFPLNYETVMW